MLMSDIIDALNRSHNHSINRPFDLWTMQQTRHFPRHNSSMIQAIIIPVYSRSCGFSSVSRAHASFIAAYVPHVSQPHPRRQFRSRFLRNHQLLSVFPLFRALASMVQLRRKTHLAETPARGVEEVPVCHLFPAGTSPSGNSRMPRRSGTDDPRGKTSGSDRTRRFPRGVAWGRDDDSDDSARRWREEVGGKTDCGSAITPYLAGDENRDFSDSGGSCSEDGVSATRGSSEVEGKGGKNGKEDPAARQFQRVGGNKNRGNSATKDRRKS